MYIDPLARGKRQQMFQWYLAQCYGDYDPVHYAAYAYRWNKAVEARLLREWITARCG